MVLKFNTTTVLCCIALITGCGDESAREIKPIVHRPSVEVYAREVKADRKRAERKYKDVLVELRGTVLEFSRDDYYNNRPPKPVITLGPTSQLDAPDWGEKLVFCIMADSAPWKQCATFSVVTLRGKCIQTPGANPMLVDCEIVASENPQVPMFSAEALAKRAAEDIAAFNAELQDFDSHPFFGRQVIIAGVVHEVGSTINDPILLESGNHVDIHLGGDNVVMGVFAATLKVGRRVKVIGTLGASDDNKENVLTIDILATARIDNLPE